MRRYVSTFCLLALTLAVAPSGRGGRMGLRLKVERDAPQRIREVGTMQGRPTPGAGA